MDEINNKTFLNEIFTDKFEKISLKIEQLTGEISNMKGEFSKMNKMNRSFGLKTLRNSQPLEYTEDIYGIGSPTKKYVLSIRAITEEWQGRKNDFLIAIRQQDKETSQDQKSLGIRIPINDVKTIRGLTKEILSLLYLVCELKSIDVNEMLRELLIEINEKVNKMITEIKTKMNL